MLKATVTSKGQITLPSEVRKALDIRTGDRIVFEVRGEELTARVLHARDINDLFAALPGVETYAGAAAERETFHKALAAEGSSDKA